MFQRFATPVAWLAGSIFASAQTPPPADEPGNSMPAFDVARAVFSHGEMDFDNGPGSLAVSRFELRSLLSKPITPMDGLTLLPLFDYRLTMLDFDGVPGGYPIDDEDLHSLSVSMFAFKTQQGSPWIYGGWARAEMASDFQDVGGDDFTFDIAGGAGYRFNDGLVLGVGAALTNINGDMTFYPGIFLDWIVTDEIRVGVYGPLLIASYTPDENWEFSFRGDPGGDVWNISDAGGNSRAIDLTSYRLGLYADRLLTGKLWLRAGAGFTLGNEIEFTETDGDRLFKQDLDSGWFGQVSLRLAAW